MDKAYGDSTFSDLPLVGEMGEGGNFDPNRTLTTFVDMLRVEAVPERGKHTGVHQECINLYLYGNISGSDEPHTFPKIQGMINASVERACHYIPNISLKSVTIADGGPMVPTSSGGAVQLNADTITDYMQHAFDRLLDRSHHRQFFRRMCFYAKLFGWQDALIDRDTREKRMIFRTLPALQWYKDPTAEHIEDMAYIGMDWPIDAQIAKRLYPQLAEKIDIAAKRAVEFAPSASGYSDVFVGATYGRPVVTLSFWWIRNREMAMTDQEAIGQGILEARQVPVEVPNAVGIGAPPASEAGNPSGSGVGSAGVPVDAGSLDELPKELEAGTSQSPAQVVEAAPQQFREALFHLKTGQEVTLEHPDWPTKLVTSKTVQLLQEIVEDEECDWPDIPVVTNYNIRIPNRPYGQSDCIRVKSSQVDTNRVNGNMVRHSEWFKGPSLFLPNSVKDDMPDIRNVGMQPNVINWVNEDTLIRLLKIFNGSPILNWAPPPLPAATLEVKRELDRNFDVTGGRPEVSQGQAPTANSSGELAKVLLDAAQSGNDFTAMDLEEMEERIAKFAMHYLLTEWDADDFYKVNRTFPNMPVPVNGQMVNVIELLLETARQMEWQYDIEPAGVKQQRQQQIREDVKAGIIDMETARDQLGYDHQQIEQRLLGMASAVGAVPGMAGPQQLQGAGSAPQPALAAASKGPAMRIASGEAA